MSWLARYDRYSGQMAFADTATTAVPYGVAFEDKRESGLWYVGIQAADDNPAEFSLSIQTSTHPTVSQACAIYP